MNANPQNAHLGVESENGAGLCWLIKEQSGKILIWVNTSIMDEYLLSIKEGGIKIENLVKHSL